MSEATRIRRLAAEAMLEMMHAVADAEGTLSREQQEYVELMCSKFGPAAKGDGPWG